MRLSPKVWLSVIAVVLLTSCVVHRQTRTTSSSSSSSTNSSSSTSSTSDATATPAPAPSWVEPPPSGPPRSDEEVCAVRQVIVEALRASSEPWAAGLAERTESAPCTLDPDGTARIGGWSLRPCEADCETMTTMRFVWREDGVETPSHAAQVERDENGFQCTDLGQYLVIPQQ